MNLALVGYEELGRFRRVLSTSSIRLILHNIVQKPNSLIAK